MVMEIEKVDPALREAVQKLPNTDPGKAWVRAGMRLATRVMPTPHIDGVTVSKETTGAGRVRVYRPERRPEHPLGDGALLWIHGGGLLLGDARQDEPLCAETARDLGIPVVSANYRFAPEHPFPAALDDLHAAWRWMHDHTSDLGVEPARIAIGGESAGGGLAASLVQRLHDEGGVQPRAQWLFAPMIDDRTAADESLDAVEHRVWNNRVNRFAWSAYLGRTPGADSLPDYAAAARRTDLSGLPPAYLAVGDIELFFAEDVDYADRLRRAGVEVELDVVPGAPHGFENWARTAEPSVALLQRAREWLRTHLEGTLPAR